MQKNGNHTAMEPAAGKPLALRRLLRTAIGILATGLGAACLAGAWPPPSNASGNGPATQSSQVTPAAQPAASPSGPGSQGTKPTRRGKRPVLIMDDQTTVEKGPVSLDEALPDPKKAAESFRVGNFYFKRGNYDAAAARFAEAVRNKPEWMDARKRHVEALAKATQWKQVGATAEAYAKDFPKPKDAEYFREMAAKAAEELRQAPPEDPGKPREPHKNPPTLW